MRKNDIINSFDSINPDEKQIGKMFEVISGSVSKKRKFSFFNESFYKRAVPALGMVILLVSVSIVYMGTRNIPGKNPGILTSQSSDDFATMCNTYEFSDKDRILIDNKIYVRMTREELDFYDLSDLQISEEKGGKIATISDNSNEFYDNCDVYRFETREDTDIVAVETSDEFILFIFEQYAE